MSASSSYAVAGAVAGAGAGSGEDSDELEYIAAAAHQRALAAAAASAESDLDLAFHLQMEEAIAASLSLVPSSSTPAVAPAATAADGGNSDVAYALGMQAEDLARFEQERRDAAASRAELRRAAADLRVRAHDARFARDVAAMPAAAWEDYGDEFERPLPPAAAAAAPAASGEGLSLPFRLYFKGMASKEVVGERGRDPGFAAIAAAICAPGGELVLQIQKPLLGFVAGNEMLQGKALVEGLNAMLGLGIRSVHVYMDYKALYNHIRGTWHPNQQKVAAMIEHVLSVQRKFEQCRISLVPRSQIKFVIKSARDVVDSQITKSLELDASKEKLETCNICLEATNASKMHTVEVCRHRFCLSCMKQHMEVKLRHGALPACPHDGCTTKLSVDGSKILLSPRLLEIMVQRIKEEQIPATEKIYCPYPKCSALMSLREVIHPVQESSSNATAITAATLRKCVQCRGSFCINCKVPWHERLTCFEYKMRNPYARPEDAKLQSLARQHLWRQCVKCKHMIELAEGCYHMTCVCGFEFCYTCGKEWKNKKATCRCPLWDEHNILYDDSEDEDDYFDDDDEDDYY